MELFEDWPYVSSLGNGEENLFDVSNVWTCLTNIYIYIYIYVYDNICVCIYIYIYIYTCIPCSPR